MISIIFLLIVSISTLIIAKDNKDNCLATWGAEYKCDQYIYSNCKNASLIVNKPQWDTCKKGQLFWDQPMHNLAITFIPPSKFRRATRRSYQFCLEKNIENYVQIFHLLSDAKEEKVQWNGPSLACFKNQKGKKFSKFRFLSGDRLNCYGDFIRYSFK